MIPRGLKFLLHGFFALLGMVLVLFEEVLWVGLGGILRQVARLAPIAWVESWIRRLPPILALPLFVLPWLIMLPVKLAALWLIAIGKIGHGALLFIGGEAFGVAFLARLYDLCRPALHQWRWFVIVEAVFLRWTNWAHRIFNTLPPVRFARTRWHRLWAEAERIALLLRQKIKPPEL
jgi:hypothetical protein